MKRYTVEKLHGCGIIRIDIDTLVELSRTAARESRKPLLIFSLEWPANLGCFPDLPSPNECAVLPMRDLRELISRSQRKASVRRTSRDDL